MNVSQAAKLQMLRHTIATLAYRAGKPLRNAPTGFADFTAPGKGENYFVADIAVGRVASEQAPAKIEF